MNNENKKNFIRTTLWIPKNLHTQAKIMAIVTHTSLSKLMRIALSKEIKELKEKANSKPIA